MSNQADVIIVGAGLSGLMTAWRCLDVNSDLNVTIIDSADEIGGDHTWSFNRSDVPKGSEDWIEPFIAYQWSRYEVKFPKRKRTLEIPYCTGNSETLRKCVQPFIDEGRLTVKLQTKVKSLTSESVVLESGERLTAQNILDARGFTPNEHVFLGYQKFVGHVIKTVKPHGIEHPIIMDATVDQIDGYRFVYCLPYSDTEILVEDTYYTDGDELQSQEVDARIKDYIRDILGIGEYELQHREKGVLPITLAVDADQRFVTEEMDATQPIKIGIRGGYYQAVTGYSCPEAMKTANLIAGLIKDAGADFGHAVQHEMYYHELDHYAEENFLRVLNRMLFRAAKPHKRYAVLQRFYGLSEGLIARFYRNRLTKTDKIRILMGKPPVPIDKALFNFSEKAFIKRERDQRESARKPEWT
ncbi:MAG: lycopene beta-cyclase CrtY [Maricaulaceae bacterium]